MEKIFEILEEDNLKTSIDTLRSTLNEMCCTIDEDEPEQNIERLLVSRKLDSLIVKYMLLKKNNIQ